MFSVLSAVLISLMYVLLGGLSPAHDWATNLALGLHHPITTDWGAGSKWCHQPQVVVLISRIQLEYLEASSPSKSVIHMTATPEQDVQCSRLSVMRLDTHTARHRQERSYGLPPPTFFTMVVSLGSTLAFFASGPSLDFSAGFTSLGFSLERKRSKWY